MIKFLAARKNYDKKNSSFEKLEYLNCLNKIILSEKVANKKISILCICWGKDFVFIFEKFFLNFLEKELPKKILNNVKLIIATDVESLRLFKKIKKLKTPYIPVEFANHTKIIWNKNLNCYEKLGLIFQIELLKAKQDGEVEKILLLNPDQMFTSNLFEHLCGKEFSEICAITAPIRCSYEQFFDEVDNNPSKGLYEISLKSMHQMQKDLTVYSPDTGMRYLQRRIAAEPWGYGIWLDKNKYVFRAFVFALLALNIKKLPNFSLSKVAPDIGFLEKLDLKDNEIHWVTDKKGAASVDLSISDRSVNFDLGEGYFIKNLAKHFAFLKIGKVNKLCFNRLFYFCNNLSKNDKNLLIKINNEFLFHQVMEKIAIYIKAIFSRRVRVKLKSYINYNTHLLKYTE